MNKKLNDLLKAPADPIDVDEALLPTVTGALKVQFPSDFLEYGRIYGSGTIHVGSYEWEIYSPFRKSFPAFVKRFFKRQDAFRQAAETSDLPLGLFPEKGGLLPFGHRDDVYFCWKTVNSPEKWTTCAIWEYQEGGYNEFDLDFTHFLISLLSRKIVVAGFTTKWDPKRDISFVPEVFGG